MECPVQPEAELEETPPVAEKDPARDGGSLALHVKDTKVHPSTDIPADGEPDRIDPDRWRPLILSFQQSYGLTPNKVHRSELAKIPRAAYRP